MNRRARAKVRFDAIRHVALKSVGDERSHAETGNVPSGLCVSCIARVVVNSPSLQPAVARVQQSVARASECFVYPAESLHVSLLGLTSREDWGSFGTERLGALVEAARDVCRGRGVVDLEIGTVNLQGAQWFLEVFAESSRWTTLRRDLTRAAGSLGEEPLAYADPEPIHLNIARRTGPWQPELCRDLLGGSESIGTMRVTLVDVVVTDFLVSPGVVRHLARIELC